MQHENTTVAKVNRSTNPADKLKENPRSSSVYIGVVARQESRPYGAF